MNINYVYDGGSAFPSDSSPRFSSGAGCGGSGAASPGMTLRDYFAAQAMTALICANEPQGAIPGWAYEMADAMLEARKKNDD